MINLKKEKRKKKINEKFYNNFIFFIIANKIIADDSANCAGVLAKLKYECNIVGKGMDKMKDFSKKNKTIDQSFKNIKDKFKKMSIDDNLNKLNIDLH